MLRAFASAVPSSSNILYVPPPSLSLTKIFTKSALPPSSAPMALCEAFLTFPGKNRGSCFTHSFLCTCLFIITPVYLHQACQLLSPQLDCALPQRGTCLTHLVVPGIWHRAGHGVAPLFYGQDSSGKSSHPAPGEWSAADLPLAPRASQAGSTCPDLPTARGLPGKQTSPSAFWRSPPPWGQQCPMYGRGT